MHLFKLKQQQLKYIYLCIIWIISAGFLFYKYLIQVSPSVMTHDLMQSFQVSGAGLGHLSAFYFYAYLLMQIPVGVLIDRYSPRLLTTLAIFVCSLATFIFSHTHTLWLACLARALMGAGSAFAAVSCFKLAAVWFTPKRFAFVSGLFMTAAMLGAVGGQMPLALLVQYKGWRDALEVVAMIGMSLGVIYYLVLRDKPQATEHVNPPKEKVITLLKRIIFNKQTWALSLYSGLAFAPVSVFGGLWGVPFLETAYQLSRTDAALAISCIFIGFAAGAPFWGWLSDYVKRRKPVLFCGTFAALICLLIVLYSAYLSLLVLMVLLFLFGFGASGFFTSFAMIREIFPLTLAATVLGIMNTFNSVFEALFEPLIGMVLDWVWDGEMLNNIPQFSIAGYHTSLLILPVSLILSLMTLLLIDETFCGTRT
ncbi:MAG: MFS transporter [Gammaproteobacteria bacterium]|nr:MFS transporter [Gammaproteobacteria bacterium]